MPQFKVEFEYLVDGQKVTQEQFNKLIDGKEDYYNIVIDNLRVIANNKAPFFLDEIIFSAPKNMSQEDLLKQLRSSNWIWSSTGGTVFEKVQDYSSIGVDKDFCKKDLTLNEKNTDPLDAYNAITGHSTRHKATGNFKKAIENHRSSLSPEHLAIQDTLSKELQKRFIREDLDKLKKQILKSSLALGIEDLTLIVNSEKEEQLKPILNKINNSETIIDENTGKKETQTVKKAPIFTFCKQMKNAVEALALRSQYGHDKYEKGEDWENFSRVENGEFEYSNASFRHALEIGEDEDEKQHLIASAWNSIAKLELYLRKNKQ